MKKASSTNSQASTSSSSSATKKLAPPATTLSQAQRFAATILEVLGGLRSPPEAAEVLGISLPRYYQLEARALEGLVVALAPRPQGKQPSLQIRLNALEKQLEAARRQCSRQEALVRVTQRALGLATAAKPSEPRDARGRKKRRPVVRALKAARTLQAQSQTVDGKNAVQTETTSLQQATPHAGAEEVRP
jgi:hypothetical protein